MQPELRFPQLSSSYIDSICHFHFQSAIAPRFSKDQIRRFLTGLISGPENAVEVWRGDERVASVVLLDQVHNIHNSAHIEFLGMSPAARWEESKLALLVDHFTHLLKRRSNKTGLILTHHSSQPWAEGTFAKLGFEPLYKTFEMQSELRFIPHVFLPEEYQNVEVFKERFDEYYDLMLESFKHNQDTSIGSREETRSVFEKRAIPTAGILYAKRLVGFCNLEFNNESGDGLIQTVGVHPDHRGHGLGRFLISNACKQLKKMGAAKVGLGVAANNASALGIYMDAGFVVTEEFSELRKRVD